jgi:hypothetical protein
LPAFLPVFYRIGNQVPYGISALSCGVKREYPLEQFLYHLLPVSVNKKKIASSVLNFLGIQIFIGSIISAAVFAVIFLVLRGTLFLQANNLGTKDEWNGSVSTEEDYHRFVAAILRSMLWSVFYHGLF